MISKIAYSLLLFFLPLAFAPVFTNQDIPKQFLLVLLVVLACFLFFRNFSKEKNISISLDSIHIFYLGFFFFLFLSTFKAMYWHNAWDRMSQWLIVLLCHSFSCFHYKERLGKNLQILFYGGVLAALYGIYQSFHIGHVHSYPAYVSTFGNINLAASIMAVLLILAMALPEVSFLVSLFRWIGWGILFFYMIRTGSRAAWLAFIAGTCCYTLLFLFSTDRFPWKKMVLFALAGFCLASTPFLFSSIRMQFFWRCQELTNWEEGSGKVRYLLWQSTGEMISKNPWTGIGSGQYSFHYPYYRTQEEYILSEGRLVEHPHNDILWIACETGIPGAICFLGIVFCTFWQLFILLKSEEKQKRKEARALISVFLAFLILGLFSFPMASASSFWIFSMITSYASCKAKPLYIPRKFLIAIAYIVTTLLFLSSFFGLIANVFFMAGQKNLLLKNYQDARKSFQIAQTLYPSGIYSVELGRSLLALGEYSEAARAFLHTIKIAPELENAAIDLGLAYRMQGDRNNALIAWEKAKKLFPLSTILHYNLARLFWETNQEQKALDCLKHLPSRNYKISQDWHYILYLGEAYQKAGNLRKAFAHYIKAKEMASNQALPNYKIGILMKELKLYDSAIYHLSQAIQLGNREEKTLAACSMGQLYEEEKNYQNAALYYLRAKQENQQNPRIYLHIAQVSLLMGKQEFAQKNLERAKDLGFKNWDALEKEEFFYPLISSIFYKNFIKF